MSARIFSISVTHHSIFKSVDPLMYPDVVFTIFTPAIIVFLDVPLPDVTSKSPAHSKQATDSQ